MEVTFRIALVIQSTQDRTYIQTYLVSLFPLKKESRLRMNLQKTVQFFHVTALDIDVVAEAELLK
jgi:hypothetical protein